MGNKYIIIIKQCSKLSKQKINHIVSEFVKKINDAEFKQTFLEETVGNLASSGFVAFCTIVGGGLAIISHPVIGSIILIFSIAYGSFLKVFCGKYYKQNNRRKIKPEMERGSTQSNLEEGIFNVFKKWGSSHSMKYLRTNTAKYGFIRLTSALSFRNKKIVPETIS